MIVISCVVSLYMSHGRSLRDNRLVLNSLNERISNSRLADQELWQRVGPGMAVVNKATQHCEEIMATVVNLFEGDHPVQILDHQTEML